MTAQNGFWTWHVSEGDTVSGGALLVELEE